MAPVLAPYAGRMDGAEVRTKEFLQTLRGYHMDDVDELLELVANELDAHRSPAGIIQEAVFRRTLRGYKRDEVDRFLQQICTEGGPLRSTWRGDEGATG